MDDLIRRADAIDALLELYEYQASFDPTEAADLVRQGVYLAEKKIESLPSAQPKTQLSTEDTTFDTTFDCISRQAAIDFVGSMNMCDEISNEAYKKLISYLDDLPSAQPEIIRCKDCRNNHWCNIQEAAMAGDNFFCGAAERRTDEQ